MDSATILVIVLTAGGLALLVWFELNSRRNQREQRLKSGGMPAGSKESAGVDKTATGGQAKQGKAA